MYIAFALLAIFAVLFAFVGATEWVGARASRAVGLGEFRLFSVNPPFRPRRGLLVSVAVIVAPLALIWALGLVHLGLQGKVVASSVVDVEGNAAQAGLRDGDRILSIDGRPTPDFDAIIAAVRARSGPAELVVESMGRRVPFTVPRDVEGRIGVWPRRVRVPLPAADIVAGALLQPFSVLGRFFTAAFREKTTLMGPVGIVRETRGVESESGLAAGLRFVAQIACLFWAGFGFASVLDVVTLPLFRRLSADVLQAQNDAELESFRLARLRAVCAWLLIVFLGAALLAGGLEIASSSPPILNLVTFGLGPALVLVSWSLTRGLYGSARAGLVLASSPIPCVNLAILVGLVVFARRVLATRGLQAGLLATRRAPAAT